MDTIESEKISINLQTSSSCLKWG